MRLLSTKTLSPITKDHLAKIGTSIVEYPLIKIQPLYLSNQKIQSMLIFTSQNAVRLANKNNALKNKIIGKKSFCVGEKTRELLEKFGYSVIGMKENADELAHFLVEKYNNNSFSFFCGRKRRSEIESLFKKNNMTIEIHELYDTLFINKKFKSSYDGIIFFSPSAVLSFFEKNKWPKDSHGFCIGKSTAETLKKYTTNYSEAKHPNEDQLLQTIINYFSKHYVKK